MELIVYLEISEVSGGTRDRVRTKEVGKKMGNNKIRLMKTSQPYEDLGKPSEISISAVIVTYNEARYLPECIRRLDFCDDILVVDVGSEDNSVEVAYSLGARVIHHDWVPFAEKAWGEAVKQMDNDWIVFMSPDLYLPRAIGPRIKSLIAKYDSEGLGAIYLPMDTGFSGKTLRHGQKGGTRFYRALAHRKRNHFKGFVHHRGDVLKEGYFALGLLRQHSEAIFHDWVDGIDELIYKARRYLPFEAESRLGVGKYFSWRGMFSEMLFSLRRDFVSNAFLEWHAVQIMLFQLWYYWKANMIVRKEEKHLAAVSRNGNTD